MSKNSIKNVLENLFLMFGRGKTQNPSILEDEEFDFLVKVELILHIFLYWS